LLRRVPSLAALIVSDSDEEIVLSNNIAIEIQTASFRTIRGFAVIAALCDEIAFWRSDEAAANPDEEVVSALRPSMATVPGAFLLAASSPYARRGILWRQFRENWGNEDAPGLVWRAPTRTMNPTVPQRVIDDAYTLDAARAAAEYGAEFRTDIETFVSREAVEACVVEGRRELLPAEEIFYVGFVDPSGAAVDSMTLCVAHREPTGNVVVDLVRERKPPFSPQAVCEEFATVLRAYGIHEVVGDRWRGEWPREQFGKWDIKYRVSELPKTQIYGEFLPLLNSGRVELLHEPRAISQLCGLERRTSRGSGKDIIDHPPGGHDDLANAVAGAVVEASAGRRGFEITPELLRLAKQIPNAKFSDRFGYAQRYGASF
jgi:hypothetical protein